MYVLVSKTRPVTFISTGLIIRTQEYLLAFVPSVFKKNGMQNIIILASDSRKDRIKWPKSTQNGHNKCHDLTMQYNDALLKYFELKVRFSCYDSGSY